MTVNTDIYFKGKPWNNTIAIKEVRKIIEMGRKDLTYSPKFWDPKLKKGKYFKVF